MSTHVDPAPRQIPITTGGVVTFPPGTTLVAARLSLLERGLLLDVDARGRFIAQRLH